MTPSNSLAQRQADFMTAILDDTADLPQGWAPDQAAGLDVYRGNYRSALMEALGDTFERTRLYVGEGPFAQVAAHHAIAHPPSGWTIDEVGEGFDQTCAELFGENPEVAELAWLEWTMLGVATASDLDPLDMTGFAAITAEFGEQDWSRMKLEFQPRAMAREVSSNLANLWSEIGEDVSNLSDPVLPDQGGCIVWREGQRPTFMQVSADEATAFDSMQNGVSYGTVLVWLAARQKGSDRFQIAASKAGEMLARWLTEGMIIRVVA